MLFVNFLKKNAEAGQAFLKSYYLYCFSNTFRMLVYTNTYSCDFIFGDIAVLN